MKLYIFDKMKLECFIQNFVWWKNWTDTNEGEIRSLH